MKFDIDYINTHFEIPVLDRINGEPNNNSLYDLKQQLKANTSQVTSDLGGGTNDHLGLVLTPVEYTHISALPYARPVHPGTLHIAAGTTQHETTRLREDHKDTIRVFREAIDVEKALTKQIVASVEGKYIGILRRPVTNTINADVPTILVHLFRNYGYVTPEVLAENTAAVKELQYSVKEPLVTVYNAIEDLKLLAKAANNPFTPVQLVDIAIQVIKNSHDFDNGLLT